MLKYLGTVPGDAWFFDNKYLVGKKCIYQNMYLIFDKDQAIEYCQTKYPNLPPDRINALEIFCFDSATVEKEDGSIVTVGHLRDQDILSKNVVISN